MLLGANSNTKPSQSESRGTVIFYLLMQDRYSEAYQLLKQEPPNALTTQYNKALCHYWAGDHREALMCLDRAQTLLPLTGVRNATDADGFFKTIRKKQNELDDHRQAILPQYVELIAATIIDNIIRLRTDCWLDLGEYLKVIDTATPIAYKGYHNITKALEIAKQNIEP